MMESYEWQRYFLTYNVYYFFTLSCSHMRTKILCDLQIHEVFQGIAATALPIAQVLQW